MSKKKKGFKSPAKSVNAVGEINVTPLIDIVLVLLIIYMVVTPVMLNQMSAELPDSTETVEQEDIPEEQLLVAACEDGTYAIDREVKDLPLIVEALRKKIKKKKKKTVVFVDSHPETPYPQVVKLMDAVREAGHQANYTAKIGLASLKTDKDFIACTPRKESPPAPAAVTPTEGG
ncbi:MAG: biopolymer transporter ExbD [Myxococcota bacterium]|nr:biopolymer transporter ExbD [Myxococcota bacterium]